MKVSSVRAALLLLFAPTRFEALNAKHTEYVNNRERGPSPPSARRVRRAFWASLGLVILSAALGYTTARLGSSIIGPATQEQHRLAQIAGIGILLWATLGKQGWSIQTWKGESLPERANEFLFRFLYVVGSFVLVLGTAWDVR